MKNENYKIAIAYRTYSGAKIQRKKAIFIKNKYMFEDFCLKSLKKSLGPLKIKIWAILDSCPRDWDNLFKKHFNNSELEIIHVKNAGELGSMQLAVNILLKQKYSDYIYMAEDDYYYLPNQFEKMISFLKNNSNIDFVTPYDHPDYYSLELHDYKSEIKVYEGNQWRNVATTCNTYLTTKKNLLLTKDIFLGNYKINNFFSKHYIKKYKFLKRIFWDFLPNPEDADVWIGLTKMNAFNLFKITKLRVKNRRVFTIFFKTWRYNWKQLIFGKKWKLWSPMPTIATPLDIPALSPNIDWKEIFIGELRNSGINDWSEYINL